MSTAHVSSADGPDLDPDRQDEPVREWCVPVAVSVMEHLPRDVLAAWMAVGGRSPV
jgi:hypothetical protein